MQSHEICSISNSKFNIIQFDELLNQEAMADIER